MSANEDRLARFAQLQIGLVAFGLSLTLMIRAGLGLAPWDVFHQGLARTLGASIGLVVIATGAAVLLLWIPLRQRPGLGTLCNVIVVGLATDATLRLIAEPEPAATRWAFLVAGIALNGFATGLYIGAGLGPGPRDGLMTGLAARGLSIRSTRTVIEVLVLAAGYAMGGTVGAGTVIYALTIGTLAHVFLPMLTRRPEPLCHAP